MKRPMLALWLLGSVVLAGGCSEPVRADSQGGDSGLALGGAMHETFETTDGATVRIPDPTGRYVILEVIRSADW